MFVWLVVRNDGYISFGPYFLPFEHIYTPAFMWWIAPSSYLDVYLSNNELWQSWHFVQRACVTEYFGMVKCLIWWSPALHLYLTCYNRNIRFSWNHKWCLMAWFPVWCSTHWQHHTRRSGVILHATFSYSSLFSSCVQPSWYTDVKGSFRFESLCWLSRSVAVSSQSQLLECA